MADEFGGRSGGSDGNEPIDNPPVYSDDEDDEVDVAAVIRDFGGHDLMQGIQRTLYDQLLRQKERVVVEKREVENELTIINRKKEQVGVELYGNQQQLARLQQALENLHSQFHSIAEARVSEEGVLEECKQRHSSLKSTYADKQKSLLKVQAELDTLTSTTSQVEKYNAEVKSEIAITRRATYKAESSVQELEKAKQGQDLYIDGLNGSVKALREQVGMYRNQLGIQAAQTEEAKKILKETAGEMDLITFEKKQLMVQWKASLINLTKRDEAVAAAKAQVEQAKVEIRDMASEMLGTKRAIAKAVQEAEISEAVRDRLTKELNGLEDQIAKILAERDVLAERYTMLQRSVAKTEEELKNTDGIAAEINKKVEAVQDNVAVVARERQKLELAILEKANEKVTVAKAIKNFAKSMATLKQQMHDQEMETTSIENELSRIRVDALNTESHNAQLREILGKAMGELNDKDRLIEKYQLEIRQRNDEIEKKMLKVDSLNRKYEKLLEAHQKAGGGEGPLLGPLEATIKATKKEIEALVDESMALQNEWLRDQTALVDTSSETEDLLEKNAELRAKVAILGEKKLRLSKHTSTAEGEVKRLQGEALGMQTDMARLNELIGKNGRLQGELVQANQLMELEFVAKLKDLEVGSLAADQKLADTVERKDVLLDEIMEAERQLLLWEKKIQLEKETQAALDPEMGMGEVHVMEKEIHRMELRLTTLRGERDRLIKDLERAVHKRESLNLRFLGQEKAAKPAPTSAAASAAAGTKKTDERTMTKAALTKKLGALKASVKAVAVSSAEYEAAILERRVNIEQMTAELEAHTANYGDLERRANELQAAINAQLYEKQRLCEAAAKRQRMVKRYQGIDSGARPAVTHSDDGVIAARLKDAEEAVAAVKRVISAVASQFGHLDEVLGRVMEIAADE